jgi:hypothetical protein
MAFTEQDALSVAKKLIHDVITDNGDECVAVTTGVLLALYDQGYKDGSSPTVKDSFWLGFRRGVERYSWWKNGVRYVGCVGTPDTTLSEILKQIEREEKGL